MLAAGLLLLLPVSYSTYTLTSEDQRFLEDLSRRSFMYFWEQVDPITGLVFDRGRDRLRLSGLCGVRSGWVEPEKAGNAPGAPFASWPKHPREHGWF